MARKSRSCKTKTKRTRSAAAKATRKVADVVKEKSPVRLPVDEIRSQLLSYADELQA
jgi:hypothetical protein